MTENEYITATNRVKVSAALHHMRDTLAGFDGVITDEIRGDLLDRLYDLESKLFAKIETLEESAPCHPKQ